MDMKQSETLSSNKNGSAEQNGQENIIRIEEPDEQIREVEEVPNTRPVSKHLPTNGNHADNKH